MGKYLYAPVLQKDESMNYLKNCVEYIGSLQCTSGSKISKGVRYIKAKTGCSGNSIKFLYKTGQKYLRHDFDVYGPDVFKYDDKKTTEILMFIISYIIKNSNEDVKKNLFSGTNPPIYFIDMLYSRQMNSLKWIDTHNYKDQKKRASILFDSIKKIDEEWK